MVRAVAVDRAVSVRKVVGLGGIARLAKATVLHVMETAANVDDRTPNRAIFRKMWVRARVRATPATRKKILVATSVRNTL